MKLTMLYREVRGNRLSMMQIDASPDDFRTHSDEDLFERWLHIHGIGGDVVLIGILTTQGSENIVWFERGEKHQQTTVDLKQTDLYNKIFSERMVAATKDNAA